jgi:hypothetical protein
MSRIQKDIDRIDEYKEKVTDLEIKIKSLFWILFIDHQQKSVL